jgi:hypothetical protein
MLHFTFLAIISADKSTVEDERLPLSIDIDAKIMQVVENILRKFGFSTDFDHLAHGSIRPDWGGIWLT